MKRWIILLGLFLTTTALAQTQAEQNKLQYWSDFREALPNPFQTIGFASFPDGSQLYIISEPPCHITLAQIEDVFGGLLFDSEVKRWTYGIDGWVKDVLITVAFAPAGCEEDIIFWLNKLLYGYSDQATFTQLPLSRKRDLFLDNSLNMSVNAESLFSWFKKDDMPLVDFEGHKTRFTDILSTRCFSVFRSSDPGFVIWTLPINGALTLSEKTIRQFTLNSDMIIGAIASANTLCILGREREEDLLDIPPLRTEEICMLAWAPNYLSQSLDVCGVLTGKMNDNNNYDWCPAYLCRELDNTELGHLMTLTDVFLKDWLRGGTYEYDQYKYRKPNYKFDEDLGSKGGVRYNWNTNGLFSKTTFGTNTSISIRNTACMNCSLFDTSDAEERSLLDEKANAYLASLNNVDLYRVAQYFALYEIFKEYGIRCPSYVPPPSLDKSGLLVDDARRVLNRLRSISEKEKNEIVYKCAVDEFDNTEDFSILEKRLEEIAASWEARFHETAEKEARSKGMSWETYYQSEEYTSARHKFETSLIQTLNSQRALYREELLRAFLNNNRQPITNSIDALLSCAKAIPTSDLDGFYRFCSNPHADNISPDKWARFHKYEHNITHTWALWRYGSFLGIDYADIERRYQQKVLNDAGPWHKTPKVLLTNNNYGTTKRADGQYHAGGMVGGHSISHQITERTPERVTVEEKSLVSHYSGRFTGTEDPLQGAAEAGRVAASAAQRGDPVAAMNHARNSSWIMSNPISPKRTNTTSPTNIVLYKQIEEAVLEAERAAMPKERETRVRQVRERRTRVVHYYERTINRVRDLESSWKPAAPTILQLERTREYLIKLNLEPTQSEVGGSSIDPPAMPMEASVVDNQLAGDTPLLEDVESLTSEIELLEKKIAAAEETLKRLEALLKQFDQKQEE